MSGSPSAAQSRPVPRPPTAGAAAAAAPDPRVCARTRLLASCLALSLGACAETGDLGRPRASVWNDLVLPAAGHGAATVRGEPASAFAYTDDERELRDRAWRFLMPEAERGLLDRTLANLVRTRILPLAARVRHGAAYHASLMGEPFRSPASRYRRIGEDAAADAHLVPPFAAVAARVLAADGQRLKALRLVRVLPPGEARDAVARVAENRCLVAWVRVEAGERAGAYAHALEHLFVEAPQPEAVEAERAVRALDPARAILDALDAPPLERACAGAGLAVEGPPVPRFAPRSAAAPGVVKD